MPEPNQFFAGQLYERGAWIPTRLHADGAAKQIAKHFGEVEEKHRVKFSKLSVEVLNGDHERAPKPQQQPFFVTVWAEVEKINPVEVIDVSWLHDLRRDDLDKLRASTKRAAERAGKNFSVRDIDLYIAMAGPRLARKILEQKIHGQLVDGKLLKAANDVRIGD